MTIRIRFTLFLSLAFCACFSQSEISGDSPTAEGSKRERTATTYLGVQANQLIRQILNFSNSNSVIDNPYLFTYSVNSKKTGVGFSSGLGFSVSNTLDGDPSNRRETNINNLSLRVGVEKKSYIAKRWLISWGVDIIHDNFKNETTNTQIFDLTNPSNKSVFTTKTTTSVWGIGPRFTLNFKVSNRIMLGTEANYYYRSGTTSLKASSNNQGNISNSENSNDFTRFQFTVPAVIYLMVTF
jgi:hypothetical protein